MPSACGNHTGRQPHGGGPTACSAACEHQGRCVKDLCSRRVIVKKVALFELLTNPSGDSYNINSPTDPVVREQMLHLRYLSSKAKLERAAHRASHHAQSTCLQHVELTGAKAAGSAAERLAQFSCACMRGQNPDGLFGLDMEEKTWSSMHFIRYLWFLMVLAWFLMVLAWIWRESGLESKA